MHSTVISVLLVVIIIILSHDFVCVYSLGVCVRVRVHVCVCVCVFECCIFGSVCCIQKTDLQLSMGREVINVVCSNKQRRKTPARYVLSHTHISYRYITTAE